MFVKTSTWKTLKRIEAALLVLAGSGMTLRSKLKIKSRIFSKENSNSTKEK